MIRTLPGLRAAIALVVALATATVGAGTALAGQSSSSSAYEGGPVFKNGKAQPVFTADKVIRKDVWVEVPEDTDGDGKHDRVHIEVARPASTEHGVDLPVIMQASPYFGGGNPITNHGVDVPLFVPDRPGAPEARTHGSGESPSDVRTMSATASAVAGAFAGRAGPSIGPSNYENYFLPRGFAFVYAESLGTGHSTGCPTIGAPSEVQGIKSVVDWLNGRATAYDSKSGGDEVVAGWTTGQTGMIGVSYNGTLPNGVAATGVEGLDAIVPISAISSWYNYYRANGSVVAPGGYQGEDTDILFDFVLTRKHPDVCDDVRARLHRKQDRLTGDYSEFWAKRNYVTDVDNVHAAVLVSHGINDHNVKPQQFAQWHKALKSHGVPHMIWLHQHGHGDWPYRLREDAWLDTLNKWWTRWLYNRHNGVMRGPKATVQREDGSWVTYPEWPAPGTQATEVALTPGGRTAGGLTLDSTRGRRVVETLVDKPSITAEELATADSSTHRLVYRTSGLDDAVRVSGAVRLDLRLSFDYPAANVTALLVDYAPDGSASVVNRGWTDPQNRVSRSVTTYLPPGRPYDIDFNLQADDYVFQPGHRIGVVLLSSDHDYTKRPPGGGTQLSVNITKSSVILPIAGGASALRTATHG